MDKFKIEATKHTPEIVYHEEGNLLEIKGESYPGNISEFYEPFFNWLDTHLKNRGEEPFTVHVDLSYVNSSTVRVLWKLFSRLQEEVENGKQVVADWIYDEDDDDKLEMGEEFQDDFKELGLNLVSK